MLPAFQPGGGFSMGGSFISQQSQPLPIKPFSPLSSPAVNILNFFDFLVFKWLLQNFTTKSNRDDVTTPLHSEPNGFLTVDSTIKKNLFGVDTSAPVTSGLSDADEDDGDDPFLFVSGAFPGKIFFPFGRAMIY